MTTQNVTIPDRYEGMSHGFSRVGSSAYRREAAELARDRTLAFLEQHLG